MIGNGILAFAVIFVIVLFLYVSMRAQRKNEGERYYNEVYTINLSKGFVGNSFSILLNDSLLLNEPIATEPYTLEFKRFAEESALMIVDNDTDIVSVFELGSRGGTYSFTRDAEGIKQLAR